MLKLVVCSMTFPPINLLFIGCLLYLNESEWGWVGSKRKEGLEEFQRFQKDNIIFKMQKAGEFLFLFLYKKFSVVCK